MVLMLSHFIISSWNQYYSCSDLFFCAGSYSGNGRAVCVWVRFIKLLT